MREDAVTGRPRGGARSGEAAGPGEAARPGGVPGRAGAALPGPLQLAYLGDAVWELHVRSAVLRAGGSPEAMHRRSVGRVRAGAQAAALHRIESRLTEEERDVARRGRNAKSGAPRGVDPLDYRHSTAFECLLGFLYYTGRWERLREVLALADQAIAEEDQGADGARGDDGTRGDQDGARPPGSFGSGGSAPDEGGKGATP